MSYKDANLDLTDAGLSEALIARLDGGWRYVHDLGAWIEWDGARWVQDQTERVMQYAILTAEMLEPVVDAIEDKDAHKAARRVWLGRLSANALSASARIARTDPAIAMVAGDLDADPMVLHVPNGRVDLRTGKLLPPDRDALNMRLATAAFDPSAKSEQWEAFVNAVTCGDKELATWLQCAVGMTLLGDQREQVVVFCHGHGANGKTTFLEAVSYALGDYSGQGAPDLVTYSQHDRHPTELFDLRGRRMVVVPELRGNRALDESKLKQISGGARTKARSMGKDFVEFPNTWQLWLDGNARPTIHGQDEGIWRRMRLVPWRMHIEKDKRDRDLPAKLRESAPAILAWAVRGCVAYLAAGKLPPCQAVDDGTEKYRREQDLVGEWLSEVHEVERWSPVANAWATAASVTASANDWCSRNNVRPWSPQALAQELQRRGCEPTRRKIGRGWSGITQEAVQKQGWIARRDEENENDERRKQWLREVK